MSIEETANFLPSSHFKSSSCVLLLDFDFWGSNTTFCAEFYLSGPPIFKVKKLKRSNFFCNSNTVFENAVKLDKRLFFKLSIFASENSNILDLEQKFVVAK